MKIKGVTIFVPLLMLFIIITGCSSREDVNVLFLEEGKTISTEGFHTYTVELTDKKGNPLAADSVFLFVNMKVMNHPMQGTMKQIEDGLYELDLPLAMAGEWLADVTVIINGEPKVFEGFELFAEGSINKEYIKGYHADE
jgi:hypothetical protein